VTGVEATESDGHSTCREFHAGRGEYKVGPGVAELGRAEGGGGEREQQSLNKHKVQLKS